MALKIFCAFIALVFIGTLLTMAIVKPDYYALAGEVVEIDRENNLVIIEDFNGNLWDYFGTENASIGRAVAMKMNGRHTMQIEDDKIVELNYSKIVG